MGGMKARKLTVLRIRKDQESAQLWVVRFAMRCVGLGGDWIFGVGGL